MHAGPGYIYKRGAILRACSSLLSNPTVHLTQSGHCWRLLEPFMTNNASACEEIAVST